MAIRSVVIERLVMSIKVSFNAGTQARQIELIDVTGREQGAEVQRQTGSVQEHGGAVSDRRRVLLMAGAVAVSIVGFLVHNAREFGLTSVLANQNGEFIVVAITGGAFLAWWQVARARPALAWVLVTLALLNLVGGAIITVLPFGLLPFVPEQSWNHYLSHIIYGATQLPLISLGIREAKHSDQM